MKVSALTRPLTLLLLAAAWLMPQHGQAQTSYGLEIGEVAPLQFTGQFQLTHANAPPGQCGCFYMTGGGLQITRSFTPSWGAQVDGYYGSNSNIDTYGDQLSIFNYLIGPRYTYRTFTRYTPYAVALAGISRVSSNTYAYKDGTSALAAQGGVGVEVWVNKRFSVPVEGDWIFSKAKNGVNTRQNNTRIGVGVTYRIGPH